MNGFGFAREYGAVFVGVAADGDDEIEINGVEGVDVLGLMMRDIDAGFGHDFDGAGIEAVGLDAGGVGFDFGGFEMAGPTLGHLAAAGVAGAEEEDFELVIRRCEHGMSDDST